MGFMSQFGQRQQPVQQQGMLPQEVRELVMRAIRDPEGTRAEMMLTYPKFAELMTGEWSGKTPQQVMRENGIGIDTLLGLVRGR